MKILAPSKSISICRRSSYSSRETFTIEEQVEKNDIADVSFMLLGLDLKVINIVGMVRLFSTHHSFFKVFGQGGHVPQKIRKK